MQRERWSIPVLGTFHGGVKMQGDASHHRRACSCCRNIYLHGDRGHSARVSVVSIKIYSKSVHKTPLTRTISRTPKRESLPGI